MEFLQYARAKVELEENRGPKILVLKGRVPTLAWIGISIYDFMDILIWQEVRMPLYIKDDTTADLVAQLAKLRGLTKQDAVRLAVQAELNRAEQAIPLRSRVQTLRAAHPLPPPTGKTADKDFFDDLSGEL